MAAQQQGDASTDTGSKYRETSTPEWTDDGKPWIANGSNRWQRSIICPQCHGSFPVMYEPLYKAIDVPLSAAWIDVHCMCQTVHTPHAAGEGCGWIGQVLFTPPSNTSLR